MSYSFRMVNSSLFVAFLVSTVRLKMHFGSLLQELWRKNAILANFQIDAGRGAQFCQHFLYKQFF